MRNLQRAAAVLIFPAIAWLGAACDQTGTPTEGRRPAGSLLLNNFDNHPPDGHLAAVPFVFIGTAAECGIAGARIVTAAWLGGMGLPDDGVGENFNLVNPADNPSKDDPHTGLLLSKNGQTPVCSSAGAEILGVAGMVVDANFALGYDNRNGTHCSGGATRFNIAWEAPITHAPGSSFAGACTNGTPGLASQDPLEWTQYRFAAANPVQTFPPIPLGSTIVSISLLFDEGTDTPGVEDPRGVGLAVVDNIYIDGHVITSGSGIVDGP
jgi:hypothetical protein